MRLGSTVLALVAVVALPRGVAKADDCTCTDSRSAAEVCVLAPASSASLASPTLADASLSAESAIATELDDGATIAVASPKPASAPYAVLWCGGADGPRCEPAAPASDASGWRLFALPFLLLPPRVALPPVQEAMNVFALEHRLGSEGVVTSVERPPRA